jgi:FlaA1/EpsC-like NDP-sugar epimerase
MWYFRLRNRHFFFGDVIALALAPFLALALRLEPEFWYRVLPALPWFTAVALAVKLPIFYRFGFYRHYWRYASMEELLVITSGVGAATVVMSALYIAGLLMGLFTRQGLPASMPLLNGLVTLLIVGGARFSIRLAEYWLTRYRGKGAKPVLIVGAGDAGSAMAREMRTNRRSGLAPVGFVDDDPHKQGMWIHGVRVLGTLKELPGFIQSYPIQEVVIAMPTAPGKLIREVARACEAAGVPSRTLPAIAELLSGHVSVNRLRSVRIEDLLRREPVQVDLRGITEMVEGRRVLVTGAGGSIGSELCRQILRCGPSQLILLGHGENSLFQLSRELNRLCLIAASSSATNLKVVVADVRDRPRLKSIFERLGPQIVFHAAAHKHVPMMEDNVEDAVTTNVLGTRNVVELAEAYGVERFVLISSDKAVNPVSIMGATKRTAERVVNDVAKRSHRPYVSVRFGNVLGSRGSVVPLFQQQIDEGGPVTVTDPEMKRYFMTIPEAVLLVLQAAVLSSNGETFILDMGQPIKIVDLAQDLIQLSGYRVGRDIDIVFTGLRPGEKLFEELFLDGEEYQRTAHTHIFSVRNGQVGPAAIDVGTLAEQVEALIAAAQSGQPNEVRQWLKRLVAEYNPSVKPTPPGGEPLPPTRPVTTPVIIPPASQVVEATSR